MLFVCFYVATLLVLRSITSALPQCLALVCVAVATTLTILFWEHGRWPLGLFVPPRLAAREALLGAALGFALIAGCALCIVATTGVRHVRGAGFPWPELLTVFIPAALHEELLFRGYVFQKLLRWNRLVALLGFAVIFAALHAGNTAVTLLGLGNIFLGGLLLGLAYERYARLWFPIGLHLAWNLTSGPILGHEVSGYVSARTFLIERGSGPLWLTGGEFGIEGSAWMTLTEVVAILLLLRMIRKKEPLNQ